MLAILPLKRENRCNQMKMYQQGHGNTGRYLRLEDAEDCGTKVLANPPMIIHSKHILECSFCGRLWGYSSRQASPETVAIWPLGAQGKEDFSEEMSLVQRPGQGGVSQVQWWEVGVSIPGRRNSVPGRPEEGVLSYSGNAGRLFIWKCQAEKLRMYTICFRL